MFSLWNVERAVMIKVVIAVCILAGSVSSAWADDLAMAAILPNTAHTIFGGVVKSVSWANPAKGTKSEIVVKDAAGKLIQVLVTSTTTLWDAHAKPIMQDKIVAKSKVNVIYFTSPEGIDVGKSIKILK
jgi:hypothetical protein